MSSYNKVKYLERRALILERAKVARELRRSRAEELKRLPPEELLEIVKGDL